MSPRTAKVAQQMEQQQQEILHLQQVQQQQQQQQYMQMQEHATMGPQQFSFPPSPKQQPQHNRAYQASLQPANISGWH
jgi:hypothetical protein